LMHHNILYKGLNPKGEVSEGSSLTIVGHCRPIYVAGVPNSDSDHNFQEVASVIHGINKPGHRICMDKRISLRDYVCSFAADLSDVDPEYDREYDRESVRQYLTVQIVRERK
jgi:hypothetical protein